MKVSIATVTLKSLGPYSQSRMHAEPKLEGESMDAYAARTWRSQLTVEKRDGVDVVVIPAHGLHQCIAAAAKYSKKQIPGQGKATWTAKFTAGIMIPENPSLGLSPDDAEMEVLSQNVDGVRGSGKRVLRYFPVFPEWETTFTVYILDPIITEQVFSEMVTLAGMFIGIGRFRPQNGGNKGRFRLANLDWQDNRQIAA